MDPDPFRPLAVPGADAYKDIGRDSEAGRLVYNLYNKKPRAYVPTVPVRVKPASERVDPHQQHQKEVKAKAEAKVAAKKGFRGPGRVVRKVAPAGPRRLPLGGKKPLAVIARETALAVPGPAESTHGRVTESRDVQIKKLQDNFSGEAKAPSAVAPVRRARGSAASTAVAPAAATTPADENAELARSIESEIEERRQFLVEMKNIGQLTREIEARVHAEIVERTRELRTLEAAAPPAKKSRAPPASVSSSSSSSSTAARAPKKAAGAGAGAGAGVEVPAAGARRASTTRP